MTNDDPSDARAGPKPRRADTAVREALVESRQALKGFLLRRLGEPEAAEEVLQDFVLRAMARSGNLREIGSLRGWLGKVLATAIADHRRRSARQRHRELATDPSDLERVAAEPDAALDETVCTCLYRLLPTLRSEYANLIWRIDLAGEPRACVAAARAVTLGTLAVRLHRARMALKRRLMEMCRTCPEHGFLDCGCDVARATCGRLRARKP